MFLSMSASDIRMKCSNLLVTGFHALAFVNLFDDLFQTSAASVKLAVGLRSLLRANGIGESRPLSSVVQPHVTEP